MGPRWVAGSRVAVLWVLLSLRYCKIFGLGGQRGRRPRLLLASWTEGGPASRSASARSLALPHPGFHAPVIRHHLLESCSLPSPCCELLLTELRPGGGCWGLCPPVSTSLCLLPHSKSALASHSSLSSHSLSTAGKLLHCVSFRSSFTHPIASRFCAEPPVRG